LVPLGCKFTVVTTTRGFWSSKAEDAELVPEVKVDRVHYPKSLVMLYLNFLYWGISRYHQSNKKFPERGAAPKEECNATRVSMVKRVTVRCLTWLSRKIQNFVDRLAFPHYSKYWAKAVVKHCQRNYKAADFDIIIATHPYAGTLLAGTELSQVFGIPWVADFRDPWSHDMQSSFWNDEKRVKKMWEVEGRVLETSSAVVSINRQMCEFINAEHDKMHVITNSFEPADYIFPSGENDEETENYLNLCYTGSIAENHEYRLFLDGLKTYQDCYQGDVVLNYYGGHFQKLQYYADEIGLDRKYIKNHGMVTHNEANRKLAKADFGIVLGWSGPLAKLVSTGKIFDSLGVKSPILGICTESGSGMEDIIIGSGAGRVLHSVSEISDALNNAILVKNETESEQEIFNQYTEDKIDRYTTKRVAKDYMVLLKSLVE
jgi:hypothetical protein